MKRKLFFLLAITLCFSVFSGCSEKKLLNDGSVKSVVVTSLPEGYEYSFAGDDAEAVIDYLSSLNLISVFSENPDEYSGMTWVIAIEYENGTEETVYHFGNMFVRRDGGAWYKMNYDEAARFSTLLDELSKDKNESPAVSNTNGLRIWDRHHPDDSECYPYFSVTLPALDNAKIEYKAEDSKIYADGEYLLGGSGNGCESFYLYDLTGDGYPELCFGMNCGSGIIDMRIEIIEYTTKEKIFSMADRMEHDYYLFLRDGVLCVKETEYANLELTRTGVLTYNGSEITVVWDSEVDARVDRDSAAPGETVH